MSKPMEVNFGKHKLCFENRKVVFATAGLLFIVFCWGIYQGFNAGAQYFGQ